MISENINSLRIFSLGQLAAATGGAASMLVLWAIVPGIPIVATLILCLVAALGAAAALRLLPLLGAHTATIVFVASGILATTLTIGIIGVGNGSAAEFIWPISVAAMLMGRRAGISTAILCIILVIAALVFERSMYVAMLEPNIGRYVGVLTVIISLALAAVVAVVAGGNIGRALLDAEDKAERLQLAFSQLSAGIVREQATKVEAEQLAEGLLSSSQQQRTTALDAASAISQISSQVSELSSTAAQIAQSAFHVLTSGRQSVALTEAARERAVADRTQLGEAVIAGEQMAQVAQQVAIQVQRTSELLNVITEIAHDSHILSLNATLEAIGAGAVGKRFGIVAAEFTALAARAGDAAAEARDIVSGVQETVSTMLPVVDVALASIRRSQEASSETEVQTLEMESAVGEVAKECMLIVSATAQQERASKLIASAIEGVSGLSRDAATQSEQLGNYAEKLNQAVDMLNWASASQLALAA